MNKLLKKSLSLLLCLTAVLWLALPAAAAAPQKRALVYTALGDSISTGYKLADIKNSYVSLFGAYLQTKPVNLGKNGLDSAGLLKRLNSEKAVIDQVKKSDVVTISMGGNDMLPIFSGLKPTSAAGLINAAKLLQGSAMQDKFSASVKRFGVNWQKIIARVKLLAPHAIIVVTTLINPYQGIVVSVPLLPKFDFGAYSDNYVRQINDMIRKDAKNGYLVADSYLSFHNFKGSGRLTNAELSKLEFDPHPNITGHSLIAAAHEQVKLDFTTDALALDGPGAVTIVSDGYSAAAALRAQPLFDCLSSSAAAVVYSVADAGSTGAKIDPATGKLTVHYPGRVTVKAVLTVQGKNIAAETTKTIRVTKAAAQRDRRVYLIAAGAVFALLLAAALIVLLRRPGARRR